MSKPKKVVVMGGGTGIFPVIRALRQLSTEISCIVAVSDSGGSTGRIRDEFGFQPVGDLRQSLAALAENNSDDWIRKILLYRFEKGDGLKGHNLGNLFLTALQDMSSSTTEALEIASRVLRIDGTVIPVTESNVQLEIHYQDGSTVIGEHTLDASAHQAGRISKIELIPAATLSPKAHSAITSADLIIIGPGDYYASLMATLAPQGIKEAFNHSQAPVAYILNLMTRYTQTDGMTAQDHLRGIENAIGKKIEIVVANDAPVPAEILELYKKELEYPVIDDLLDETHVIKTDLMTSTAAAISVNDIAHRSILRHDSQKIKTVLDKILHEHS
ncbi:MAG: YvcK family protein [bacterium]|nr:YvcK family protein [bacterium]